MMNKRRRAYKAHRERRRFPVTCASLYADDAVCIEIEPVSEMNRRGNALKRQFGIPQHMAMMGVYNLKTGDRKHLQISKETNKRLVKIWRDNTKET